MFEFLKRKTKSDNSFFSHYKLLDKIGKGGYGTVYTCRSVTTGQIYAVKIVPDKRYSRKTWCKRRSLMLPDEIMLWEKCSHQTIVKLHDLFIEDEWWLTVMEYNSNFVDLDQYTACHGILSCDMARDILKQVVGVCEYLYQNGIDHRDIKAENILFNPSTHEIRLLDFGSASVYYGEILYGSLQGTEAYVPPEYHRKGCYYPKSGATWSIGCLGYLLLKGHLPYSSRDEILNGNAVDFTEINNILAVSFISECLLFNIKCRLNFDNLSNHIWMSV